MTLLNRRGIKRNYIPLSSSFCKSILKDKCYKSTDNQYTLFISDAYFSISNKDNSYSFRIYKDEPKDFQILTLIHHKFSKNVLVNHCGFTGSEVNDVIPVIFKNDYSIFQFVLSIIPKCAYSVDQIYMQVERVLMDIFKASKVSDITKVYNITKKNLKEIMSFFNISLMDTNGSSINLLSTTASFEGLDVENLLDYNIPLVKNKRDFRSTFSIYDYKSLLGIDYDLNYQAILEELYKNPTNSYLLNLSDKEKALCVIYKHLYHFYIYNRPFYPFEDRILKEYYNKLGYRVVDIFKSLYPDYIVRENIEYINRVYEKGYKTPHPSLSFKSEDSWSEVVYKEIYKNVKKSYKKYFFWQDNYDLQYNLEILGLCKSRTKVKKECLNLKDIDITSYIKSAKKFKEFIYHSSFWTSDKHDKFRELYPIQGLSVCSVISGLSIDEAKKHSSNYRIYQNYTPSEVSKMHQVYLDKGLEGLISEFPNRTVDALKYKIEDEGWSKDECHHYSEKDFENRLNELLDQYKQEYIKKTRESLISSVRDELRKSLYDSVVSEIKKSEGAKIRQELESIKRDEIKDELREELEKLISESLRKEMCLEVKDKLENILKLSLSKISIFDLSTTFPKSVSDELLNQISIQK